MKFRVRMSQVLEFTVECDSEEQIAGYLDCNTIDDVALDIRQQTGSNPYVDYTDEVLCPVREDAEVDLIIVEKKDLEVLKNSLKGAYILYGSCIAFARNNEDIQVWLSHRAITEKEAKELRAYNTFLFWKKGGLS